MKCIQTYFYNILHHVKFDDTGVVLSYNRKVICNKSSNNPSGFNPHIRKKLFLFVLKKCKNIHFHLNIVKLQNQIIFGEKQTMYDKSIVVLHSDPVMYYVIE